jgi:hypothetical protein
MKYIKKSILFAFLFCTGTAQAYETKCSYSVLGTDPYSVIATEKTLLDFTLESVTPDYCIRQAAHDVQTIYSIQRGPKYTYAVPAKKVVIQIVHQDNVDFPAKQLMEFINKNPCLTIQKSFTFTEGFFSDYFEAVVEKKVDCKK